MTQRVRGDIRVHPDRVVAGPPDKRDRFLGASPRTPPPRCATSRAVCGLTSLEDAQQPNHFYFYEIYRDADAFAAHKAAPHFAAWRRAAEECVVPGSQVNTFSDMIVSHAAEVSA